MQTLPQLQILPVVNDNTTFYLNMQPNYGGKTNYFYASPNVTFSPITNTLNLASNLIVTGNITGTLANTGVTTGTYGGSTAIPVVTINAGGQITYAGNASITIIANNSVAQLASLGVGTSASGTTGEIRATNNITAYYSDDRLKTKLGAIVDALDKVKSLNGFYYEANEIAQALGYEPIREVGVSAQEVQAILPEIVVPAPIDDKYLTVRYEKLIPLLVEAIKELSEEVDRLKDNK